MGPSVAAVMAALAMTIGSQNECEVRLDARPVAEADEPAARRTIDVAIVNVGTSYCVLFPRWFPEDRGNTVVPRGWLRIEVVSRDGRALPAAPTAHGPEDERLREPSVRDFLVLGPGHLWGMRVNLSEGPWAVVWPLSGGTFIVRATTQISGQDWLRERKLLETDPPLRRFIQGTFAARPIEVVVK
jgi:hypothetical protein